MVNTCRLGSKGNSADERLIVFLEQVWTLMTGQALHGGESLGNAVVTRREKRQSAKTPSGVLRADAPPRAAQARPTVDILLLLSRPS